MLWIDKHKPSKLSQLTYHDSLTTRLTRLCKSGDLPHLFLYGPPGGGKRTRVSCILTAIFGPGAEKRRVTHRTFKVKSPRVDVEVTTMSSPYHIEVNPSDAGNNDRLVVQELIKDIASSAPLDVATGSRKGFKVVVLFEVDLMSRLAQHALRRTMEKYSKTCRIILVANSATKVLEPLRSRCLGIRVGLPTKDQVVASLEHVAGKEGLTAPRELLEVIADKSERNMRKALLQLESTRVQAGSMILNSDSNVPISDWEDLCQDIAKRLAKTQSADTLVEVRRILYLLLTHAIPADFILKRITFELLKLVDTDISSEVCKCAAKFDHRLTQGTKKIFHLEAFAAQFMFIYKRFLTAQVAMFD